MRVLWITNIVFPEALRLLRGAGELRMSGGWLLGAAEALVRQPDIELSVATVSKEVKELTRLEGERITYWLLPFGKGNTRVNHSYEPLWLEVRNAANPDVVHIHGTEFSHGLAYVEACGSENVCVSIQGLVSVYQRYYYDGLSLGEIRRAITPASIFINGIMKGYRSFKRRAGIEVQILSKVRHFIGRTSWDRDHLWAINPDATYHYGGESLRSAFYESSTWKYSECTPRRIFLSQADYPIKGLHQVLKAMPLVLRHYPDATIHIAGYDICNVKGLKNLLNLSDYGRIIRRMIKRNGLEGKVKFTGSLDADGMVTEYLQSNVFVCPSSIENSPNSVGEAQVLGVPVIASYCGGIPDMMKGDEGQMYRFEEIEMLAHKIVQVFDSKDDVQTDRMRQVALKRHNPEENARELMNIYNSICR